jgi:hypothetical protein
MALGLLLAGLGLCLVAVAVGLLIGSRLEFRRMAQRMVDDAEAWLDRRASAA